MSSIASLPNMTWFTSSTTASNWLSNAWAPNSTFGPGQATQNMLDMTTAEANAFATASQSHLTGQAQLAAAAAQDRMAKKQRELTNQLNQLEGNSSSKSVNILA